MLTPRLAIAKIAAQRWRRPLIICSPAFREWFAPTFLENPMTNLEKLLKCLFHPASIVLLILALAVGMSMAQSAKEEGAEVVKAKVLKSAGDRLGLVVECLNGIQYWTVQGDNTQALTLSPKWSQGRNYPDACES